MKWIIIVVFGYIAVIFLGMFFILGKETPKSTFKPKVEIKEEIDDVEKYGKMRRKTDL